MQSKPRVRISAYSRMNPYGRDLIERAPPMRGSRPASTLPPSSGGIGIMLKTASSTLSCSALLEERGDRRRDIRLAERHAARSAATRSADRGHDAPARDCSPDRRRRSARSRAADGADGAMLTGTGFAQPISGAPLIIAISGNRTVPMGSACTIGFSDTRPSSRAVGSPSAIGGPRMRHLVHGQREQQHDEAR